MLRVVGLSKRFEAVTALDGVDLELRGGEVLGLMGENGAGKSTLIRCLTGVHRADTGTIELDGRPIAPASPRQAEALGISCVHQEVHLIPHASVAENVCIGREPTVGWLGGSIRWRRVRERAAVALARVGLSIDVRRGLDSCPTAVRQLVAIARALDIDARVLILDEPTSSLDRADAERLFAVLRRLRGEGLSILLVTHFLDQVFGIADRIQVLRDGQAVGVRDTAELGRAELVSMMVGHPAAGAPATPARRDAPHAVPALAARGIMRRGALERVDCTALRGETVGLAGLLGSGRSETLRALFGAEPIDGGGVEIGGARCAPGSPRSPREALRLGLAFLPEDRALDGVLPDLSVLENIVVALQARRGVARRLGRREADAIAGRYIAALRIRTPSPDTPMRRLSGGNQQKALLARALALDPAILLLDEPTRGIDVGARDDVASIIAATCRGGVAVLLASSDLDELIAICRRVVVLRDRRSVAELVAPDVTTAALVRTIAASGEADT